MKLVRATRKGINMELTIALAISILSAVMTVVNFALNPKALEKARAICSKASAASLRK